VVHSASHTLAARLAVAGFALTALSGCVTTQQTNARTVLVNERTLESQSAVSVTRPNPAVAVTAVSLLRSGATDAVVVRVRNRSARPISDLPISVGIRTRSGRAIYLNRAANLAYLDTHIASIGAHAGTIWVFTVHRAPVLGGRPFAVVGLARVPATTSQHSLPPIDVAAAPPNRTGGRGGELRVAVTDASGVPQYGLPVYAVALRDGRPVAAWRTTIATLDGGARTTLAVKLLGTPIGAAIQLSAPPTIFN
jgi:hypothetical protein